MRPHAADDDRPAFELVAGRDEILRWLVWNGPASEAELREHYRHWRLESDEGNDYRFAIEDVASERFAGSIAVRFTGHPRTGDVGYWIGEPFWGRGIGTEALGLVCHLAFRHLGADSLYAWVFVGNAASRKILERNGFSLVRTVPGRVVKHGGAIDEWHFTLLESEWRRLARGFRPRSEDVAFEEADGACARAPRAPFPGEVGG